jgi:hypothetical protein
MANYRNLLVTPWNVLAPVIAAKLVKPALLTNYLPLQTSGVTAAAGLTRFTNPVLPFRHENHQAIAAD